MFKKVLFAVTVLFINVGISHGLLLKPDMKIYHFGSTSQIVKPKIDNTTKSLISAHKANKNEENLINLRKQVEINYDKAILKAKDKLAKLEKKSRKQVKIDEMRELVDIIERDKENRIFWTLDRYTGSHLTKNVKAGKDGFLPLYDEGLDVSIANSPVTNSQFAEFIKETDYKTQGDFVSDNGDYSATNISYYDALAYSNWLSKKDKNATYRLPTEKERKLMQKHLPKVDASKNKKIIPVSNNSETTSENLWEWTTTTKDSASKIVRGATVKSKLGIKKRKEFKNSSLGYDDVTFRLIKISR